MVDKGRCNPPTGDKHYSHTNPERVARGEAYNRSDLTEDVVRNIRAEYALGGITQQVLAAKYGVSRQNISYIINKKLWKHVK
jgi:DNA-binding XRE family transcriptional regulator